MIKYVMKKGESAVSMGWSEGNEEIAKKEALDGKYDIIEIEVDENALED